MGEHANQMREFFREYGLRKAENLAMIAPGSTCYDFALAAQLKISCSELNSATPEMPEVWEVRFPNSEFPEIYPPGELSVHVYIAHRGIAYGRSVTWPYEKSRAYPFQYPDMDFSILKQIGHDVTPGLLRATAKVLVQMESEQDDPIVNLNDTFRWQIINTLIAFNTLYPRITSDELLKTVFIGLGKYNVPPEGLT